MTFSATALEVNASASRMLLDRNVKGKILLLNTKFKGKLFRTKTNTKITKEKCRYFSIQFMLLENL